MTRYGFGCRPARGDSVHHDSLGLGRVVDSDMYPRVGVDFGDGWVSFLSADFVRRIDVPALERPCLDDLPPLPEGEQLCGSCIDGLQPAGLHDLLGPVLAGCRDCYGICPICDGEGLFPADETCIGCYADTLASRGLVADRCPNCFGIRDLIPISNPSEVNPHGHHN